MQAHSYPSIDGSGQKSIANNKRAQKTFCARSFQDSLRKRNSLARVHKRKPAVANLLVQVWYCLIDQFV